MDEEKLEKLAQVHCTMEEMAYVMGCSAEHLKRHYDELIKRGRSKGKVSLRHKQYQMAMDGSVPMAIWLGKMMLGQKDNSIDIKLLIQSVQKLHDDQLIELAKEKLKEIEGKLSEDESPEIIPLAVEKIIK